MHELPFIILARRGDDDGNQEPAQNVLHEAETWRQSHVQGPCCCGLDSESTNVHAYIDRAGRGGGGCGRRGRTLPQTTRVRKAINKQDTSRMSNINNKNESRCRTLHPFSHVSLLPPLSLSSSQLPLGAFAWMMSEWQCVSGSPSWAERGKDVCLFMLCLLAPLETPKTSDRFAPT